MHDLIQLSPHPLPQRGQTVRIDIMLARRRPQRKQAGFRLFQRRRRILARIRRHIDGRARLASLDQRTLQRLAGRTHALRQRA